jgi:hypothetical protein
VTSSAELLKVCDESVEKVFRFSLTPKIIELCVNLHRLFQSKKAAYGTRASIRGSHADVYIRVGRDVVPTDWDPGATATPSEIAAAYPPRRVEQARKRPLAFYIFSVDNLRCWTTAWDFFLRMEHKTAGKTVVKISRCGAFLRGYLCGR